MIRLTNKKGFTLLEVLISVLIILIGFLSVAGLQTTGITGNAHARDLSIAIQMAEEMVDRIRTNAGNTPDIYDNIDTSGNCSGADPAVGDCNQWKSRLQKSGLYGAKGTVDVTINSPISNSATVTVTVTWGPIATRRVTFTTIIETWAS